MYYALCFLSCYLCLLYSFLSPTLISPFSFLCFLNPPFFPFYLLFLSTSLSPLRRYTFPFLIPYILRFTLLFLSFPFSFFISFFYCLLFLYFLVASPPPLSFINLFVKVRGWISVTCMTLCSVIGWTMRDVYTHLISVCRPVLKLLRR